MNYQVLARKWRPKSFETVVGQDHIVQALRNGLSQNRIHHAYMFTGTRGVGKTTIARIMAKCLNCETGVTAQPCEQCQTCVAINEGRFVDLIEVDAASRTKVEDTRELLDNVQYAPVQGRTKIYLIDEVHMLSTHSFNALLKTLEEPPEHAKFLLATTDPQKVPVTILSRCLQFTLKQLQPETIAAHLETVFDAEGVTYDSAALLLLGKAARGSVRDALSLSDQAIAFGAGAVKLDQVQAMLGTVHQGALLSLLTALSQAQPESVLQQLNDCVNEGIDPEQLLQDLLNALHRLSLARSVPDYLERVDPLDQEWMSLAKVFTAEALQVYYQIALLGLRDLSFAPDKRQGVEMLLLRMMLFDIQTHPQDPDGSKQPNDHQSTSDQTTERMSEARPLSGSESGRTHQRPVSSPVSATAELVETVSASKETKTTKQAAVPKQVTTPKQITAAETTLTSNTAAAEPKQGAKTQEKATQKTVAEVTQPEVKQSTVKEPAAHPATLQKPHREPKLVSAPKTPEPKLSDLERWQSLIDRARHGAQPLKGAALNLAKNCVLTGVAEGRLCLAIAPDMAMLLTTHAQQALKDSLLALSLPGVEHVQIGREPHKKLTPAAHEADTQAKALESARIALETDPVVQTLTDRFGARLVPDSVVARQANIQEQDACEGEQVCEPVSQQQSSTKDHRLLESAGYAV